MAEPPGREHRGPLRRLVRWFVAVYYPRMEIADGDRIPQGGPVLLCANHCNSLIDPVIIGIAARRPVRFMAKAPLFDHPLLGPAITALGMVPAFRGTDDPSQVRRNLESLDVGAKVLVEGHAMGIFPEGKSTDQSHLEMIRSGAARMALQAAESGARDVCVVPIGLTYERRERFRSAVLVRVGEPIGVNALLAAHGGNERAARRELTSQLESRLKQIVVHLEEPLWEPWFEYLELLVPARRDAPHGPARRLWQRKRIADAINFFLASDRARADSIAWEIADFHRRVREIGLALDSPLLHNRGLRTALPLLASLACLLLLFIPALWGTLYHVVPFVVVRAIASRMDARTTQTTSTHRLMVGAPFYPVWYAVVTVMLLFWNARLAFASLLLAPFTGLVAFHYWPRAVHTMVLAYHHARALVSRGELLDLRQRLTALRERLGEMADEYRRVAEEPRPSGKP